MPNKIRKIFVYATLGLIPFYFFRLSIGPIKTNILEIFVALSVIFYLVDVIRNKHKVEWGPIFPYLFVLAAFLSIFFSPDKMEALGIFKGWFLTPIMVYWVLINGSKEKDIAKFAVPIFFSLVIISIWAIFQRLGVVSTLFYQSGDASFNQYLEGRRAFGPFDSPNFLAMYLVPSFFLALPVFTLSKQKFLVSLLFLLPLTALYFTGSKGGFIAFFLGLAIYANYRYINVLKAAQRRPIYLSLILLTLIFIYLAYIFIFANTNAELSGSNAIRQEIYHYSMALIKNNPIFGIGMGSFQEKIREISSNNISFTEYGLPYALHPHNLGLALWLNLGLAGLVLFLINLSVFCRNVFTSNSYIRAILLAAMASILIHGLFDSTYFKNDLSVMFWLIMSYSLLISKNVNEV